MLRYKKTCENCQTTYDMMDFECPNCHQENEDFKKTHTSKYTVNLPLVHQILFIVIGYVGLNAISILAQIIILAINGFPSEAANDALNNSLVTVITYSVLFLGFMIFVIFDRKKFKHIFKSWVPYVAGFVGGIVLILVSIVYNMIVSNLLNVTENANEEAVQSILKSLPVLSVIILGLVGPICEELTYRVGLFSLVNRWNKVMAYIISIVVFALIHFDWMSIVNLPKEGGNAVFVNELLNLPSYLIAGVGLAFLYDRFGLVASTTAHITNNLISVLATLVESNAK